MRNFCSFFFERLLDDNSNILQTHWEKWSFYALLGDTFEGSFFSVFLCSFLYSN